MTPQEALGIVAQAAGMAALPRAAHGRVDQALLLLAQAAGIEVNVPTPPVESSAEA